MRTMLWTAALLLGAGFSLALPAMSAQRPAADIAAAPAAAVAAAAQAAPGAGAAAAPAAQEQGAAAPAAAPDAGGGTAAPPAAAAAPADAAPQAPAPAASDAAAAQLQPPQPVAAAKPVDLDETIDRFRQTLARESGFSAWKNASWTSYPLGPGTHGYIVLLAAGGKEVGYMIISAAEDGTFKLTEYGLGPRPLFSLSTLYRSLVQLELIPSSVKLADFMNDRLSRKERLYAGPLHAVWKLAIGGEIVYLDAKTGEKLPVDESLFPKRKANPAAIPNATAPNESNDASAVQTKLLLPAFDPYDRITWVKGKPLAVPTFDSVKKMLSGKQRLTYVSELYNGKVTIPLAVIGYHIWSGSHEPYMAVDQDGVRYIRYTALGDAGRFYP